MLLMLPLHFLLLFDSPCHSIPYIKMFIFSKCFVDVSAVKPKERSIHFPEHEKILQTTLESYVIRVSIITDKYCCVC